MIPVIIFVTNEQSEPFLEIKRNLSSLVNYLDKNKSNEKMEFDDLNRRFDEVIRLVEQAFERIMNIDFSVPDLSNALEDICDFLESVQTHHYLAGLMPRPHDLLVANKFSELYGRIGPDILYCFLVHKQECINKNALEKVATTIGILTKKSLNFHSNWFVSIGFVDQMNMSVSENGNLPKKYFEHLKPLMKTNMLAAKTGAAVVESIPRLHLLWCELSLYSIDIPMMTNTPFIARDFDSDELSDFTIDFAAEILDSIYDILLEHDSSSNLDYYSHLMHWCRLRRGFLQHEFGKFSDEENWHVLMLERMINAQMGHVDMVDISLVDDTSQWWYKFYNKKGPSALRVLENMMLSNEPMHQLQSDGILFIGNGPFESDDLAEFLKNQGIIESAGDCNFENPCPTSHIILGDDIQVQEMVNVISDIFESLEMSVGSKFGGVKVYTQTLFLMEYYHNIAVWKNSDVLQLFSSNHIILNELSKGLESEKIAFDWKTYKIISSGQKTGHKPNLPEQSPLSALGYSASKASALTTSFRRSILKKCLSAPLALLPFCKSESYMALWGEEDTCMRLIRVAKQVAYCPPNTSQETESIKQSDLDYLKNEFYLNKCSNQIWPSLSTFEV